MRALMKGILMFMVGVATQASAATVVDLGGASGGPSDYSVAVSGLGNLFIDYADNNSGSRSTFNGVAGNGIPIPHFGLDAGDSLTITGDFVFSALQFAIWDLDTVTQPNTESLTLSNGTDEILLTGVNFNITNSQSSSISNVLFASITRGANGIITLTAGEAGAAFAIGGITVVPIPAAAWLFGSALMGLVGLSRRRRSQFA